MGKDDILVETVGAGQDEVEIAATAYTTVAVTVPGMGDAQAPRPVSWKRPTFWW